MSISNPPSYRPISTFFGAACWVAAGVGAVVVADAGAGAGVGAFFVGEAGRVDLEANELVDVAFWIPGGNGFGWANFASIFCTFWLL